MKVRFFDPSISYRKNKSEIDSEIQRVLGAGDLILRKDVEQFEASFAVCVGTTYAVGVASGTDALILSLKACGIRPGDEVITPSYTFRATVEAIHHAGGVPILTDLEEDWRPYKTEKTKFIIPVHIAGEICLWARDDDVTMIEDACQAILAGDVVGKTACYSFYPAKILGCYGDGGAIATNTKTLYEELKIMRNHYKGHWGKYGYNSRLDNLQAAVLNVRMKYLPGYIERRKEIATLYDYGLGGVGKPGIREVYQDYIITHPKRNGLYEYLEARGIETIKNEYLFPKDLVKGPKTLKYESESLRLPCNPDLTTLQVEYIIENVNEFTKK